MMRKVGVLGGGQLGRMLGQAASQLNIPISILDVGTGPAKLVCVGPHVDGSFTDGDKIRELAGLVDVLTVEIEHVDVDALESVAGLVEIHPSPGTIRVIQDKFLQKEHLRERGCAVGACTAVEGDKVAEAVERLGGEWPVMVKKRRLAYDGRGNYVARTAAEAAEAARALGEGLYVEKWVAFKRELAVMVVRGVDGSVRSYAAVETVHRDNVCHVVYAPALSCGDARGVAEAAVRTFEGAGVFGVEMFEAEDGRLLINEIAPRPHNSGHLTIEACHTSQYENHLRAILGLPLGDTAMKVPAAAMLNLLGDDDYSPALSIPGASIHLYAKAAPRPGRKMGHITIVGNSHHEVRTRLALLTPPPPATPHPLISIIMGSDSDLPTMTPAARILDDFGVPYELTLVSAHRTPLRLVAFAQAAASRGIRAIIAGAGGAAHLPGMVAALTPLPVVGVPVATKSSTLSGIDALYSIVQMPKGVPVATVAVNGAQNAALLVLRMLAPHDPAIMLKMQTYITNLEQEVSTKIDRLDNVGWQNYNN